MITKKNTYTKALEIKKENLAAKQRQYDIMLNAAYASHPELKGYDDKLSALGASLAITALSGDAEKLAEIKQQSLEISALKKVILKKCQVQDVVYDCPICADTGYVNGKLCDCVKKIANAIAIKEFNKMMPIDDCTFENFDLKYYNDANARRRMTSILKQCTEYVIGFDPNASSNLLFLGGPGLGKTHLTMAIVAGVIEKGYFPVYGPADSLFSAIEKEKFQSENNGAYEQMLNCDLLVIDDLGTEMVTSFTKSALYNLINTRLLTKKPTIINTNLSMEEIISKYTPRIASRLFGEFSTSQFLGTDIRQQKLLGN